MGKDDLKDNFPGDNISNEQQISAVSVRLPAFWANSPSVWFVLAESQFSLAQCKSEVSKYNYVVATLPQDIAESISDLLQNPPEGNLYTKLKETLITRHSLSIENRLRKLVSDEKMGDKKPSEFYRSLKQLAGTTSAVVGDDLIKNIWCTRLPHVINIALIPHNDEPIDKILKVSDQIWEALQNSNISTVDTNNFPSSSKTNDINKFEHLEREILELKGIVTKLATNINRSRSRDRNERNFSRSNSRSKSRKRNNLSPNSKLCWFHFRYGDNARKCVEPCLRKGDLATTSNANKKN